MGNLHNTKPRWARYTVGMLLRSLAVFCLPLVASAQPCVDFYQYACGTWIKENPVPADQSRWGRFNELRQKNQQILREILEAAAPGDRVGDYYTACMDQKGIEEKGIAPIHDDL